MSQRIFAAVAFAVLVSAGCFDREPPSLVSKDASRKIPAIKQAADQHDEKAVPQLVEDLDSEDPAVRFYAIEGLERLTGQTFGYVYYEDAAKRRDSVMQWRKWLEDKSGGKGPP